MIKKLIIPAALSLAVLGTTASPALARHRNDNRSHLAVRRSNWGGARQRVADRARRLYREGRLSRDHYDRTLANLDRGRGEDWADQVNDTLTKWSQADTRQRRR